MLVNSIRRWFTLVEILIVLALIGLFIGSLSYWNNDSRIAQTKSERLANNINDTIRLARSNMILGRWVLSGSSLVVATQRVISISWGGINTVYGTTNTGTENRLPWPFFDNDKQYQITDMSVSSGVLLNGQMPTWDQTGITASDITVLANGNLQISALWVATPINILRITAWYAGFERSVIIDRMTWNSEVVNGRWNVTPSISPATVPASVTAWSVCSSGNQTRICTEQTGWDPVTCVSLGAVSGNNSRTCGTPASATAWSACSGGNQSNFCSEAGWWGTPTCAGLWFSAGSNNQACGINWWWSAYGNCDQTCGAGNKTRTCTNPAPSGGGISCIGLPTLACNLGACGSNPTALSITHSSGNKSFTFSWNGGAGNGWSCKLQYLKNGATWTDMSASMYNRDTAITNQWVSLPWDGWNNPWSTIQIRAIRASDSLPVGVFPQNLTCSAIGSSASSTPSKDENCNWLWDDSNPWQAYVAPNTANPWQPYIAPTPLQGNPSYPSGLPVYIAPTPWQPYIAASSTEGEAWEGEFSGRPIGAGMLWTTSQVIDDSLVSWYSYMDRFYMDNRVITSVNGVWPSSIAVTRKHYRLLVPVLGWQYYGTDSPDNLPYSSYLEPANLGYLGDPTGVIGFYKHSLPVSNPWQAYVAPTPWQGNASYPSGLPVYIAPTPWQPYIAPFYENISVVGMSAANIRNIYNDGYIRTNGILIFRDATGWPNIISTNVEFWDDAAMNAGSNDMYDFTYHHTDSNGILEYQHDFGFGKIMHLRSISSVNPIASPWQPYIAPSWN